VLPTGHDGQGYVASAPTPASVTENGVCTATYRSVNSYTTR
jgi:hypothetical protein